VRGLVLLSLSGARFSANVQAPACCNMWRAFPSMAAVARRAGGRGAGPPPAENGPTSNTMAQGDFSPSPTWSKGPGADAEATTRALPTRFRCLNRDRSGGQPAGSPGASMSASFRPRNSTRRDGKVTGPLTTRR